MDEKAEGAKRYREGLAALGLSQEGIARRLGVSLSTSQRYAGGKSRVPTHVLELIDRWLTEAKKPKRKRST